MKRVWWGSLVLVATTACAGGRGSASPGEAGPRPGGGADTDTAGAAVQPELLSDSTAHPGGVPDSVSADPAPAVSALDTMADPWAVDTTAGRTDGPDTPDPMAAGDSAAEVGAPTSPARLPVPILPGALLPETRIVAFYGNPASTRMGILGELPPDEMLARLDAEVEAWRTADPVTPVKPALQLIAVMATGDPGRDSLFRLRMPDHRIRQVADWAQRRDALLFLDVQPGRSTVAEELEPLRDWLVRPHVHLALDPEWAMPPDGVPGLQIGSMTADDVNFAIDFLADLVDRYHLPPKVLVVHRFTTSMIQRADEIRRDPRVQVVINMDGWGSPPQKRTAYRDIVAPEADQFTGFKLFFHNDRRDGSLLLTPAEILELDPAPVYIQYQ